MQTVTVTDISGNKPITIPVDPRCEREGACLDLIIQMKVHDGCGICVRVSLRTDGSVHFWQTYFDGGANHWAHVVPDMNGHEHSLPIPTEAQRKTVAEWWSGKSRPLGLVSGVGVSLFHWAFDGMTPDHISKTYLDGAPVVLP